MNVTLLYIALAVAQAACALQAQAIGAGDGPSLEVAVSPSEATLEVGAELQLHACVAGACGDELTSSLAWSSSRPSVATVSAEGVVRGLNPGDTEIRARTDSGYGSARIRVVRLGPSAGATTARPNEPGGFVRLAEHDFSCRPGEGCALAGTWTESANSYHRANLSIAESSDAPVSGPGVARTRFPRGLQAGIGPVSFGWNASGREFRSLYISKWIRISGPDYENHPGLTKMGWIGFGQSAHDTQGTLGVQTSPTAPRTQIVSRLQPTFRQQGHTGGAVWGRGNVIRVGEWQHWELLFTMNDVGRRNGVMKWWIDGDLILSRDDMVFVTAGNERGFFSYRWNPTWGGAGDYVKTRDDFIDIDHIYISGSD